MIFAGPSVPNPTEILEKRYFEELLKFGREHFNYVLLDCAPIGAAIDAAVIAKHCDGAILVIAQGMARGRLILNVKKQLEANTMIKTPTIHFQITGVPTINPTPKAKAIAITVPTATVMIKRIKP